jgi:hypothetical protein
VNKVLLRLAGFRTRKSMISNKILAYKTRNFTASKWKHTGKMEGQERYRM